MVYLRLHHEWGKLVYQAGPSSHPPENLSGGRESVRLDRLGGSLHVHPMGGILIISECPGLLSAYLVS